jgi:predicted CXXCH cytochrome family protein
LKDPQEKRSRPGMTCVHCHNPHQGIGPKWTRTPQEDDAKCLDCHEQFTDKTRRRAHTHHAENSEGDRCMNCHMPRITESLQDVVRTHMIFNPTDRRMIEANHPNACNLCHLKENIDWTLSYLKQWYPRTAGPYAADKLAAQYPNRNGPVGLGWLKSAHPPTRLVAAETLARVNARWALPDLVGLLDDPYLINRRFTQVRLGEMLGTDLRQFGYRFYQMPAERQAPIEKIRAQFLPSPGKK